MNQVPGSQKRMGLSSSVDDKEQATSLPDLLDYFQEQAGFLLGFSLGRPSAILLIFSLDDKDSA